MLINSTNKELPNCPFIYDQSTTVVYPVIYQKKIKDVSPRFHYLTKKYINNFNEIQKNAEYFVNVQFVENIQNMKKEIYVSFHTWLILTLNPNISVLPNNVNISSNFCAGIYPIFASISEAYDKNVEHVKTCNTYKLIRQGIGINNLTLEYAKITTLNKKIEMLPSNSCNFVLKYDDYPINSFFSVVQNPSIYIAENQNYITSTKHFEKTAITLHITLEKSNLNNIDEIVNYLNEQFGLTIEI